MCRGDGSLVCPWERVTVFTITMLVLLAEAGPATGTTLRFEITVTKEFVTEPRDGRLLLLLGRESDGEPRHHISYESANGPLVLGVDVHKLSAGRTYVVDQQALAFPITHLAKLPQGKYVVQAVFHHNRDLNLVDAPGNLHSDPAPLKLDPARGGTFQLQLAHQVSDEKAPEETEYVHYVKLRSELLSKFHRRPIYLRAGVILPRGFDQDEKRTYPLWVHIGGYGSRYTTVDSMMAHEAAFRRLWLAARTPRMILLHLDGAGPYGDPYQVNSANNGPYGDAITQELIPFVERKYRGIGQGYARVLDGHSTGGWVSLALQVFYPDSFNGCWSGSPDPVDFRAYELMDIYQDDNAYVNRQGLERPSSREVNGDPRTLIRGECLLERVLGLGGRWELSGKDWCAWNAVFGPRGDDGLPKPLWDGATGKIDRSVVEHWKKYDLRLVLQQRWPALEPKLRGKIHISVGEADNYFLNNSVHLLDSFLSQARPPYRGKILYGPRKDHSWRGWTDRQMMQQMATAIEKARRSQQ
jgi:hypothetical protein